MKKTEVEFALKNNFLMQVKKNRRPLLLSLHGKKDGDEKTDVT